MDAKVGQSPASHHIQVLLYMYTVPRALGQYKGVIFDGIVGYPDYADHVSHTALEDKFVENT